VTEGKVLERQRPLRPEERPGGSDEASEDVQHGPAAMPEQSEIFKDFAVDEFLVTTAFTRGLAGTLGRGFPIRRGDSGRLRQSSKSCDTDPMKRRVREAEGRRALQTDDPYTNPFAPPGSDAEDSADPPIRALARDRRSSWRETRYIVSLRTRSRFATAFNIASAVLSAILAVASLCLLGNLEGTGSLDGASLTALWRWTQVAGTLVYPVVCVCTVAFRSTGAIRPARSAGSGSR
jgi:hypothetical protein